MRLRTFSTLIVVWSLIVTAFVAAPQNPGKTLLEQARAKKTAGDLQGAAEDFEKVVAQYSSSDHNSTANALLELGSFAEMLGQSSRARTYYDRVRNEFSDQRTEVGISLNRLTDMEVRSNPGKIVIKAPFTEDPYSFAISPDGRTVVYQSTSADGKRQLWRQPVDPDGKGEAIAGTEGAGQGSRPFFSPDGRSIGFFARQKLFQVPLAGGTAKELLDAPTPNGGSWSSTGAILVSGRGLGGSIEVLQEGRLTPTSASGFVVSPQFLDSNRFLYFAKDNRGTGRLDIGSLDGQAPSGRGLPIAHAGAFAQDYLFFVTPGGGLNALKFDVRELTASGSPIMIAERVGKEDRSAGQAAFSVSAAGPVAYRETAAVKRQMVWIDRTGATLGNVGQADAASAATPRVSPDGKFVLIFRQSGAPLGSVWMVDTTSGEMRQVRDAALAPVWSSTGDRMLYATLRQGAFAPLMTERSVAAISQTAIGQARGGPNAAQEQYIGPTSPSAFPEDWAANGFILFRQGGGGASLDGGSLFVLPPFATDPIPVATTAAAERNGRFSPDGNWIAYQSDESGRNEVYVQPFPGTYAQRQRVSLGGGTSPQWGRRGAELYFIAADNRLMVTTATTGLADQRRTIEFGTPKPLFSTPLQQGSEYDTVRDGDRFLVMRPAEESPPIIVLSNWNPK
jgi:Tol biopolymer transport system component